MSTRKIDQKRRDLAREVRRSSVEAFHGRLADAGVERAFIVFENGEFTLSHPKLLAPLQAYLELSQDFAEHEGLFFGREPGLPTVFLASVHDTRRGLAQGGVRFKPYENLAELVFDGLRLAQGMTRKNALAGLWWGGGKGVISLTESLDTPAYRTEKTPERLELFRAYGRFIASLGGIYHTAEDVGTKTSDMNAILSANRFTTCVGTELGGSGNPSPHTARGVFRGMQAAWRFLTGSDDLTGVRVAVQGVGNVGEPLVALLEDAGARVWATDIDPRALAELVERRPRVVAVAPEEIFSLDADVFAPCAIGAQVNSRTIPELKVKLVCGGANNILEEPADGERLRERGIAFVPDYLCNRMGITNCADEWQGYLEGDVELAAERVYPDTLQVLKEARVQDITPSAAADQLADLAAAELHPLIGHRGRRLADHLIASGWHGRRRRGKSGDFKPAFVPAVDEPAARLAWEARRHALPEQGSVATVPLPAGSRPDLAAFFPAVLADVRCRALELLEGRRPRCVVGSDPAGLTLELAVARSLPWEPEEIGRPQFLEHCHDFYRRSDAAIREQLHELGVSFDPQGWLDTLSEKGRESVRRLYHALDDAGLLDRREGQVYVLLEEPARRLVRSIRSGAVTFSGKRWRRRALDQLEAPEHWCISRQHGWGHELPGREGHDVLSPWFALAALSLTAAGWPESPEPEPIDEVFTDPDFLYRWVLPSQMLSLQLTGRPAFRQIHVHGALHAIERTLEVRDDAPKDAPDEERHLARFVKRPMRRRLGRAVEPATLVRRFGADALRLGYLLALGAGTAEAPTLTEAVLRRSRKAIRRLASKVAGLYQLATDPGPQLHGDGWVVVRARDTAAEARGAFEDNRLAEVGRLFVRAVDDFARYAEVAAERRGRDEGPGAVRAATAAAIAELAQGFSPACPFLFEKLGSWTRARSEGEIVLGEAPHPDDGPEAALWYRSLHA